MKDPLRNLRSLLRDVSSVDLTREKIEVLRTCYHRGGYSDRILITRSLQAAGASGRVVDYVRGTGPRPAPAE